MPCFVAQSFAFASGNSCFNNSRVQKHKNSACAEFLGLLCRFFVAQSFAFASGNSCFNNSRVQKHKMSPLTLFGRHDRFGSLCNLGFLAAFATLVCQRNCVFLCKGTKLKNSACAEFLGLLCRFFCDTELWFCCF